MSTTIHASGSKLLPLAGVIVLVAIVVGGGLWLSRGDDDKTSDANVGADPFQNAITDDRAPEMTVTVRDVDEQSVADIAYEASTDDIPSRATTVYFQTLDEGTWSTTHSLSSNVLNPAGDKIVEGAADEISEDAAAGPGPDTYPLPDLNADATYRICVLFVVGHPATDAIGCSTPFNSR